MSKTTKKEGTIENETKEMSTKVEEKPGLLARAGRHLKEHGGKYACAILGVVAGAMITTKLSNNNNDSYEDTEDYELYEEDVISDEDNSEGE